MKVFTRDYRITGDYHPVFAEYFGDMKGCVLDIETTGLSRMTCRCVLTGLLTQTDSGVRATQFLAENHYEEAKVLEATLDYLESEGIGYVITYNGAAFDMPFLNARLANNFMDAHIGLYNFDLLRFLRQNTDLKVRIGSLSQKSVEDHYGILSDRGDTISGRESVMLFDQYAVSGNSTIEKIILTHNREDIVHLNRLMYPALAEFGGEASRGDAYGKVFSSSDEGRGPFRHAAEGGKADLHAALSSYGFPAAGGRLSVRPSIKKPRGGSPYMLHITGEQLREPVSCAFFDDENSPVTAIFNGTSSSYEIDAPLGRHGDDLFIDVRGLGFGRPDAGGASNAPASKYSTAANAPAPGHSALQSWDPEADVDCVNGYLVIGPRTTNLVSRLLAESYFAKSR